MDNFVFKVGDIATYNEKNPRGGYIHRKAVIMRISGETVLLKPVSGILFELRMSEIYQENVNGCQVRPIHTGFGLNFGEYRQELGHCIGVIQKQQGKRRGKQCGKQQSFLVFQRPAGGFICCKLRQPKVTTEKNRNRYFDPDPDLSDEWLK